MLTKDITNERIYKWQYIIWFTYKQVFIISCERVVLVSTIEHEQSKRKIPVAIILTTRNSTRAHPVYHLLCGTK